MDYPNELTMSNVRLEGMVTVNLPIVSAQINAYGSSDSTSIYESRITIKAPPPQGAMV